MQRQDAYLVAEHTGCDRRLTVAADGKGLIGHAGAARLRRCADRTGLTATLGPGLPHGGGADWREGAEELITLRRGRGPPTGRPAPARGPRTP